MQRSVLGITDFGQVVGSPYIPPSYITIYFVSFLVVLTVLYIYFYLKKRPVLIWHKIQLLIVLAVFIKITVIGGGTLLTAYWLIPTPTVHTSTPAPDSSSFSPTNSIEILFDRPLKRTTLEKSISPDVPGRWVFENSLYATHLYRKLVFYPTYSLKPGTTYTITLSGIRNLMGISKPYTHQFSFTTQEAPSVLAVSPSHESLNVENNAQVVVTLDHPNENISEFTFRFEPSLDFDVTLDTTKTKYTLTPANPFTPQTMYRLFVEKTDVIVNTEDGVVIEREPAQDVYSGTFTTKPPSEGLFGSIMKTLLPKAVPSIIHMTPQDGWTAVNVQSPIKLTFDRQVNHKTAEEQFNISPHIEGIFSWEENTLSFMPQKPLEFSTIYTVTHSSGFQSRFTTQNSTTKLAVPSYLQKYTLSCEIASLRMALNYRGANVTEDELIPQVGQDPTAHKGNIWGNPNEAFVGNIAGTQMKDGYGVHWKPIAKAAKNYREAQDFEGWTIEALTAEILKGNPVVIWVYSHHGSKTSWTTPDGTSVYAVRDEHAVVVVGFVGPANNPTQIIINDPLVGQVYWSRASFDKKWDIFGRSGVVVY
jgi:uncharacterized protein YvpB